MDIWRIFGDGVHGASAALLKYQPGANIPRHRHEGVEIIVVLRGSQTDEQAIIAVDELRVHHLHTGHSVRSDDGCLVLVWEQPVVFEGPGQKQSIAHIGPPAPNIASSPNAADFAMLSACRAASPSRCWPA